MMDSSPSDAPSTSSPESAPAPPVSDQTPVPTAGEHSKIENHGWSYDVIQLLREWRNRTRACQAAYFMVAERTRRYNYMLGIPVVILSTLVGTTIFSDLIDHESSLRYFFGSVSVVAGILASLQTFLRFSETSSSHATSGETYAGIRREIEAILALPPALRGDPAQRLDEIRTQMDAVGKDSHALSERLWRRLAPHFSLDEPSPDTWSGGTSPLRTETGPDRV